MKLNTIAIKYFGINIDPEEFIKKYSESKYVQWKYKEYKKELESDNRCSYYEFNG